MKPPTPEQDARFAEAQRLTRAMRAVETNPAIRVYRLYDLAAALLIKASVDGQLSFEQIVEAAEEYLAESASDGPAR